MDHVFETRKRASDAAAAFIADALREALQTEADTALVVSGGTSPVDCFRTLSTASLEWSRVTVLLSDERWVAPGDDDSNQRLVEQELLQQSAAAATLLPVFEAGVTPEQRSDSLTSAFRDLPKPIGCCLLGMGADGHFASLFPDAGELAIGLDAENPNAYLAVHTPSSPHVRVSMSLAALLQSTVLVLLFFGEEKRAVYQAALQDDSTLPVARLLQQEVVPVHLFWAP